MRRRRRLVPARRPRRARREAAAGALRTPTAAGWAARVLFAVGLLLGVLAMPVLAPSPGYADLISLAAIFGCVGLSLHVLIGHVGQISLGHQALFGAGAFASAILTADPRLALPFAVGAGGAAVLGALAAVLVGYPALRVRGQLLAVVTLAFGLVAEHVLFPAGPLARGLPAERPLGLEDSRAYAYLCLVALAVLLLVDWRLMSTKAGRALRAIKDDERVAAAFGVDITGGKLFALGVSGAMAGLAGALYAHLVGVVGGTGQFDLVLGLTFVAMVVVGGPGDRAGVVVAAALFAVLGEGLGRLAGTGTVLDAGRAPLAAAAAALLLLALLRAPDSVGELLRPLGRWLQGGPLRAPAQGSGGSGGPHGRP